MSRFLMKPKIDFAFKEIMTDADARKGFLSAILKLDPSDIRDTRILNTFLRKVHKDDKQGILDVRISMNDDTEIDVEIQLSEFRAGRTAPCSTLQRCTRSRLRPGRPMTC